MGDNNKVQKQHFYFGTVEIHFRIVQIVFKGSCRTEVKKLVWYPGQNTEQPCTMIYRKITFVTLFEEYLFEEVI